MKSFFLISALALAGLAGGCGSSGELVIGRSDSVRFKMPPEVVAVKHELVAPFDIEVIDVTEAKRPYVVVGLAEAETATLHDAVDRLRQEASKMGGDAILDIVPTHSGSPNLGVPIVGDLSFRSGRIWTARVIRWVRPGPNPGGASGLR